LDWGDSIAWTAFGLIGQTAFFSRFLLQWIVSERSKMSVVPKAFWYLSLIGSAALLTYAIHREEPIFALGQSVGSIVYVRNLVLIHRQREADASSGPG